MFRDIATDQIGNKRGDKHGDKKETSTSERDTKNGWERGRKR
jgi:hypothetical protein